MARAASYFAQPVRVTPSQCPSAATHMPTPMPALTALGVGDVHLILQHPPRAGHLRASPQASSQLAAGLAAGMGRVF